jgi:hypothetical protein
MDPAKHIGPRCVVIDSDHGMAITGNLLARRFAVLARATGWVTDITYPWTLQGLVVSSGDCEICTRAG